MRTSWPTSPANRRVASSARSVSEARALQSGQHLVHSVRQLVHLTAGVTLRQPARQVPRGGHARDRAPQPRQGRERRAGEQAGEDHRQADAEHRDQRHAALHGVDAVLERARVGAELDQPAPEGPRKPGGSCSSIVRMRHLPPPASTVAKPGSCGAGRPSSGTSPAGSQHLTVADHAHERAALAPAGRAVPACRRRPGLRPRRRLERSRRLGRRRAPRGRPAPVHGSPARGRGSTAPGPRTWPPSARPPAISTSATAAVAATVTRALMLEPAHARRTNPTPRTVWIIRASPSASSLRRR